MIFFTDVRRYFVKLYERRKRVLAHLAKPMWAIVFLIEVTISKMLSGKKNIII